jgi:integrase
MVEAREALARAPIFSGLKGGTLKSLERAAKVRRFAPSELLVKEGKEAAAFFVLCRGQPLCRSAMRTIFQRLGREASVPKVHPQRFRHTFATWAIEQQAREIDVQFLLGHSTPAMLRRYTATYDAEKAAQAHALFSPADRSQRAAPRGWQWGQEGLRSLRSP